MEKYPFDTKHEIVTTTGIIGYIPKDVIGSRIYTPKNQYSKLEMLQLATLLEQYDDTPVVELNRFITAGVINSIRPGTIISERIQKDPRLMYSTYYKEMSF